MSERRPRPAPASAPERAKPSYNAVVASASIMRAKPSGRRHSTATSAWQEDAWNFYDENGELRFAVGWIANGLSRIKLVPARRSDDLEAPPAHLKGESAIEKAAINLTAAIAGGIDGRALMLARLATLLTVPGIGWILIEATGGSKPSKSSDKSSPDETWKWTVLSSDELRSQGKDYEIDEPDGTGWRKIAGPHVLIKVWRSHPRRASHPDSSCRGALRPLRQLAMLDDHIDATAESRLAGAGLLVLPNEIEFAPMAREPESSNGDDDGPIDDDEQPDGATVDDFTEILVDSMTAPISDRASAGAVVPLTIKVPGEYVDKVRHITFWSEFSDTILGLGERAIKRLALALDMPPEVITGVAAMNHWGAWRVQEEAVTLHIIPLGEVICHALTNFYFRPALLAMGFKREEVDELLIAPDATTLTVRPDLSDDTMAAWDRLQASDSAFRREIGLSDADAPDEDEWRRRYIMRIIDRNPEMAHVLLPELGIEINLPERQEQPFPAEATETTPGRQIGGTPDSSSDASNGDRAVTSAATPKFPPHRELADSHLSALVASCDGLVYRALERAGARLRNKAGRREREVEGGAAAVDCEDPTELHTRIDVSTFSNVHELLAAAWTRVPEIAERYDVPADHLLTTLDSYTRGLLVNGQAHDVDRLRDALLPAGALVR